MFIYLCVNVLNKKKLQGEDVLEGILWICTSVVVRPLVTGGSRGTAS